MTSSKHGCVPSPKLPGVCHGNSPAEGEGRRPYHVAVLQVPPALQQLLHHVQVPFLGGRYKRCPVILEHKTLRYRFKTKNNIQNEGKEA